MRVVGTHGNLVGFARRLDGGDVIVGRPNDEDIRVPASAWRLAPGDRIVLNIAADEVERMHWTPGTRTIDWLAHF